MNEDMRMNDQSIREALACVANVLDLRRLTDDERAHIVSLETATEQSGAAGGMVDFFNEGIRGALACEIVYAATTGPMLEDPAQPWMVMVDSEDKLVGEWLPESRRDEVRNGGTATFLSPDFVIYKDRKPKGKSRIVMPFICVPLEGAEGELTTCGIGTPSGPADEYIRSLMGNPGREIATLVVGISPLPPAAADKQGETT
jgi:hypothetical protein